MVSLVNDEVKNTLEAVGTFFTSHEPGGVSCSPKGYRFGFGSPTRLVRFGL